MDDLSHDVREIKTHVLELVKQGAVHNEMLKEHEARSVAVQALAETNKKEVDTRLQPLEQAYQFGTRLKSLLGWLIAAVGGVASVIHYFFSH